MSPKRLAKRGPGFSAVTRTRDLCSPSAAPPRDSSRRIPFSPAWVPGRERSCSSRGLSDSAPPGPRLPFSESRRSFPRRSSGRPAGSRTGARCEASPARPWTRATGLLATLDQLARLNGIAIRLTRPAAELLHPRAAAAGLRAGLSPLALLGVLHGEFELVFTVPGKPTRHARRRGRATRLGSPGNRHHRAGTRTLRRRPAHRRSPRQEPPLRVPGRPGLVCRGPRGTGLTLESSSSFTSSIAAPTF